MQKLKQLLNWLKGLFLHSKEKTEMTDTVVEVPVTDQTAVAVEPATPTAEVKGGVQDLDKALELIEHGVSLLGEAAKDELKALAKKYL